MKYVLKGLGAALLLALGLTQAHAQMVNFTLTGTVNNTMQNTWYYDKNVFGLSIGDTITATASFDDRLINAGGTSLIDFDAPGIEMIINVGNTTFTDDDDFSAGAWLYFYDGLFDGLSFNSDVWDKDFDSSNFCCDFNGDDFDGTWTSASVSAVPVPAAIWLFGSGLLGLAGMARRKAS